MEIKIFSYFGESCDQVCGRALSGLNKWNLGAMPTAFISYSHDTAEHKNRVLALSDRLRADGVDCYIDQYEQSPAEGWPLWCEKQIEAADFVLVACTKTYLRRFRNEETPGTGKGVTWEGHIIAQELYDAQGNNTKRLLNNNLYN
jgi:hypothetical protein